MGCWFGHNWNTVDEYKVEPHSMDGLQMERVPISLIRELIAKNAGGYKVIHQECLRCGERRVFHKW